MSVLEKCYVSEAESVGDGTFLCDGTKRRRREWVERSQSITSEVTRTGEEYGSLWCWFTSKIWCGFFLFVSTNCLRAYLQSPSENEINLTIQTAEFPNIAFCNENPFKRSVIEADDAFSEIRRFIANYEAIETKQTKNDLYLILDGGAGTIHRGKKARHMLRMLISQLSDAKRFEAGYNFEELVMECSFGGITCTSHDFESFLHPDYGVCFSFSGGKNITQAGKRLGLRLAMTIEQSAPERGRFEWMPTTEAAGIQVVIYGKGEHADFTKNGFRISAGTEALVAFTRQTFTAYLRHTNLKVTTSYCQHECLQEMALMKCNCADPLFSKKENYCKTPTDVKCLMDLTHKMAPANSDTGRTLCNCSKPCSETLYKRSISTSQFPSGKYLVAVGTQKQRAALLAEQNGGRKGNGDDTWIDYDVSSKTKCLLDKLDPPARMCSTDPIFPNPNLVIVQGWPCRSTKQCKSCVFLKNTVPKDGWPCKMGNFPPGACDARNGIAASTMSCKEFFDKFDFVVMGTETPNFDWSYGKDPSSFRTCDGDQDGVVECFKKTLCLTNSTNPDDVMRNPLIDGSFIREQSIKSLNGITACAFANAARAASLQKYNCGGGAKPSAGFLCSHYPNNSLMRKREIVEGKTSNVDVPGFGSCEYANKRFKGAEACIKWYQRNGLIATFYFGSLEVKTVTKVATYPLTNFISDVSGHAGLWLGMSVITIVELFGLIFLCCRALLCGRRHIIDPEEVQIEAERRVPQIVD